MLAVVYPDLFRPAITVGVVFHHVLGRYTSPIVHDDTHENLFLVRLPSPTDMDKFDGHAWTWCAENVFFRCVLRLVHAPEFDFFIDQAPVQLE